jgi:hypothetical protein
VDWGMGLPPLVECAIARQKVDDTLVSVPPNMGGDFAMRYVAKCHKPTSAARLEPAGHPSAESGSGIHGAAQLSDLPRTS